MHHPLLHRGLPGVVAAIPRRSHGGHPVAAQPPSLQLPPGNFLAVALQPTQCLSLLYCCINPVLYTSLSRNCCYYFMKALIFHYSSRTGLAGLMEGSQASETVCFTMDDGTPPCEFTPRRWKGTFPAQSDGESGQSSCTATTPPKKENNNFVSSASNHYPSWWRRFVLVSAPKKLSG